MEKSLIQKKNKALRSKSILISPSFQVPGGIAGYCQTLVKYLKDDFKVFHIGANSAGESIFFKPFNLARDISRLFINFLFEKQTYDRVLINPSLIPFCVVREGLLLCVSKIFRRKCIVFFHGWDHQFADYIEKRFLKLFYNVYNQAEAFIVLSGEFKTKLRSWGFKQPIHLEKTMVDDELVCGWSLEQRLRFWNDHRPQLNLLFFSRIESDKGIMEVIDALALLVDKYPHIQLKIAGNGSLLKSALKHVDEIGKKDYVAYLGWVRGRAKSDLLSTSDVLVLPSDREGMPICVLEAMSFGVPVIITPVGGINDFFEDGRFGFVLKEKKPEKIASLVDTIVSVDGLYENMCRESFFYAHENFLASIVSRRIKLLCFNL